ncbi:MAG: hypothetical protein QOD57_4647 [Actinomycetota bacterium]|nr:hypothetical protein [Actinomycetota bacterium]
MMTTCAARSRVPPDERPSPPKLNSNLNQVAPASDTTVSTEPTGYHGLNLAFEVFDQFVRLLMLFARIAAALRI